MKFEKTNELLYYLGCIYPMLQNYLKDSRVFQGTLRFWGADVEKLSNAEINLGVYKCKRDLELPPSLTQFLKRCQIQPEDLKLESDWRVSLHSKDKMYDTVNKSISQSDKTKAWWDYEKIFKIKYERVITKKVTEANEDLQIKCDIIHRLIGKQNLLLTAGI